MSASSRSSHTLNICFGLVHLFFFICYLLNASWAHDSRFQPRLLHNRDIAYLRIVHTFRRRRTVNVKLIFFFAHTICFHEFVFMYSINCCSLLKILIISRVHSSIVRWWAPMWLCTKDRKIVSAWLWVPKGGRRHRIVLEKRV